MNVTTATVFVAVAFAGFSGFPINSNSAVVDEKRTESKVKEEEKEELELAVESWVLLSVSKINFRL